MKYTGRNVWLVFYVFLFSVNFGMGQDAAIFSDNIKKFAEIYGFATQIMNFGGNFIGGNQPNGQLPTSSQNNFYLGNDYATYKPINSIAENKIYGSGVYPAGDYYGNLGGTLSEYGGGPLGASNSRSQPKSIIENLMGTFLGSSVDNGYSPAASFGQFGSESGRQRSGSDIEGIVRALVKNGAKRAEAPDDGATSFLSQFFGGRKK